jgi:hypothetical protein
MDIIAEGKQNCDDFPALIDNAKAYVSSRVICGVRRWRCCASRSSAAWTPIRVNASPAADAFVDQPRADGQQQQERNAASVGRCVELCRPRTEQYGASCRCQAKDAADQRRSVAIVEWPYLG